MPSAKHFRLKILTDNKTNLDLSCFHLYNDNLRVDEAATISLGFFPSSGTSEILKNTVPIESESLKINNINNFRFLQLYIIWSFSVNTNVNAFRIGSGNSENTYIDKFLLQWSDDKLKFTTFIQIAPDKKLAYPGPWALSELKVLGECFPALLKRVDKTQSDVIHFPVNIGDDGRSLIGSVKEKNVSFIENINNIGTITIEIPGFYKKGKFYFEVSKIMNGNYGEENNSIILLLAVNTTEKTSVAEVSKKYPGFALNNNLSYVMQAVNELEVTIIQTPEPDQYVPGYFSGFMVDFDTRVLKFLNPKWNSTSTGSFSFPSEVDMKSIGINSNYKLFIRIQKITSSFKGIEINFGQKPFYNTVPVGYNFGIGPRWKEVIDDFTNKDFKWPLKHNEDLEPYCFLESNLTEFKISKPLLEYPIKGAGNYYIKGTITRIPSLENKKFIVQLYNVSLRTTIGECLVTKNGLYEFLNIEYGPYIVTSIDLKNNTVVESIGPVYPLEVQ